MDLNCSGAASPGYAGDVNLTRTARLAGITCDMAISHSLSHLAKKSVFRVANGILRVLRVEERPRRFLSDNDASSRPSRRAGNECDTHYLTKKHRCFALRGVRRPLNNGCVFRTSLHVGKSRIAVMIRKYRVRERDRRGSIGPEAE